VEGKSSHVCWSQSVARLGVAGQCALLAAVALATYAMVSPVAYHLYGLPGCLAAAVGALLPLLGSELAIVAYRLGDAPSAPLRGMLLGMMLRLGVPLAGSLAIRLRGGPIFEAGALYYLILFYLVMLAAEVGFEVGQIPRGLASRRCSQG